MVTKKTQKPTLTEKQTECVGHLCYDRTEKKLVFKIDKCSREIESHLEDQTPMVIRKIVSEPKPEVAKEEKP